MVGSRARRFGGRRAWLLVDELLVRPTRPVDALRAHWVMWRGDRELAAGATRDQPRRPLCVIIDRSFPNPKVDSGSERILRVATLIAAHGWEVAVLSVTGRKAARITEDTDVEAVEPELGYDPDHFAAHVAAADLVILSRPQVAARLGPIVRRLTRGLVVYDTVDLHYIRFRREAETTGRRRPRLRAALYRSLETRLTTSSDCTVVVSPDERAGLLELCPADDVLVIPNVHPRRVGAPPGPAGRRHLLFVGSFKHGPNVDAVAFLLDEVMPLVWAADPDVRLRVVGHGLPAPLQQRLGDDYLGWVDDLDPLLDGSLALVAPLRFGAGVKGKVGRALAAGLPVVTTSVGAEGLGLEDEKSAFVREQPQGLADACLDLARDPAMWVRVSDAGRELVEEHFSPEAVAAAVQDLLARATRAT